MTPDRQNDTDQYFTDQEFAALLGISVVRLRNKVSAGEPLPPYVQPPGCQKRFWNRDKVNDWLTRYGIGGHESPRPDGAKELRRPLGCPPPESLDSTMKKSCSGQPRMVSGLSPPKPLGNDTSRVVNEFRNAETRPGKNHRLRQRAWVYRCDQSERVARVRVLRTGQVTGAQLAFQKAQTTGNVGRIDMEFMSAAQPVAARCFLMVAYSDWRPHTRQVHGRRWECRTTPERTRGRNETLPRILNSRHCAKELL